MNGLQRIINVSNRLPVKLERINGTLSFEASEGGLATGLSSLFKKYDNLWIGWPGAVVEDEKKDEVVAQLKDRRLHPVFLSQEEIFDYYEGFCNETIWPLFHYFPNYSGYCPQSFETYKSVNQKFADEIIRFATPDDIIWIHDYQLMLVPQMVREKLPDVSIGFFLHIPFPSYPIFMALPWRTEILSGLMGADLIGFQTQDDVKHFTEAANRMLDLNFTGNVAAYESRTVTARAFPISIDYKKYNDLAQDGSTNRFDASIQTMINGCKLAISVDRLDYSKGIIQRLKAFEQFLESHPEWVEKIVLLHLVVPSRDNVKKYKELKEEMDGLVNSINGKFATLNWQPIRHFYRSVQPELLVAIYKRADIALVTPLRDGMNLVSKEFVASNVNRNGVLILSEMAGAAKELQDAIIINPNNAAEYAEGINTALTMPAGERNNRMQNMQQTIVNADIFNWADSFMKDLNDFKKDIDIKSARFIGPLMLQQLELKYAYSNQRLIMLDYDGTLVPFHGDPQAAKPDAELLEIIDKLAKDEANKVVIISGRDHFTLGNWLGSLPVDLIAEHGAWYKEASGEWHSRQEMNTTWKSDFFNTLNVFTKGTPGSLIEEKTYSIAWHYRQCDPELGRIRAAEIVEALQQRSNELGLQLLLGDKVIEIKNVGINKGIAAKKWMGKQTYDYIMAIGDDTTDEDMFKALPGHCTTIKVGTNITSAFYFVNSYKETRKLLWKFVNSTRPVNLGKDLQLAS